MSPPAEPLTFADLTEVYRREKGSKSITEVRKDLYSAMRECLERLKRESEREFAADQFSTKSKLASNQLMKFQEKAAQVFEFRMEKILAMALRAAEGNRVDSNKLTVEEREVFDRVSFLLKERHAVMLEGTRPKTSEAEEPTVDVKVPALVTEAVREEEVFDSSQTAVVAPAMTAMPLVATPSAILPADIPVTRPVPAPPLAFASKPVETPLQPKPIVEKIAVPTTTGPASSGEHVLLRILEDIPAFAGSDRNYKLQKEDIVSLPPTIAKALVARKKALIVRSGGDKKD